MANGGTLYYLQYPRTAEEIANLSPRVKRHLPIRRWLPEIQAGMREAVKRGTGKKARARGQLIYGKTGTCSQYNRPLRTRLGWFASYNEGANKQLAVVVMLRGGPMMYGPRAAEIAGDIYRTLGQRNYLTSVPRQQAQVVALETCCAP